MHPELRGAEMPIMMVSGPNFGNAKIQTSPIRKFTKINFAIKWFQFHYFETTFGASGAPGRGDADYDGLGAKMPKFENAKN